VRIPVGSGKLVPRNDAEAYYFFGLSIWKCGREAEADEGSEDRKKRSDLVDRREAVAVRLTPEQRREQDARVQKSVAHLRAEFGCEYLADLDIGPQTGLFPASTPDLPSQLGISPADWQTIQTLISNHHDYYPVHIERNRLGLIGVRKRPASAKPSSGHIFFFHKHEWHWLPYWEMSSWEIEE
jgi:hypothetical protein